MAIKVICINKDNGHHSNPHEAITNFGWVDDNGITKGNYTRVQMIAYLDAHGSAYVVSSDGRSKAYLETFWHGGKRFVRTIPDWTKQDNLLTLPECRVGLIR